MLFSLKFPQLFRGFRQWQDNLRKIYQEGYWWFNWFWLCTKRFCFWTSIGSMISVNLLWSFITFFNGKHSKRLPSQFQTIRCPRWGFIYCWYAPSYVWGGTLGKAGGCISLHTSLVTLHAEMGDRLLVVIAERSPSLVRNQRRLRFILEYSLSHYLNMKLSASYYDDLYWHYDSLRTL